MKAIRSRLAASALLVSASSCAICSRLTVTCYSCYQSQSRPYECGTYCDPHVCDDERLDEKHAHNTDTGANSESVALTLKKFKGPVVEVE